MLEISRSAFYKYRNTIDKDYYDYRLIKGIFEDNMYSYGYRRISLALLDEYGLIMNRKKVARIMKKYGLKARYLKKSNHEKAKEKREENRKEDLLRRNFHQRGWVTDITYLIFGNKRSYLSTILDLETRDWISYKIQKYNTNELVMNTLNEAISKTKDLNGLILHSDQGFQYFSTEYQQTCVSNGILISMSRKGTPLDNAVIESFHSILKKETLHNYNIKSLEQYIALVHKWMNFYNTKRIRLSKK